MGLGNCGLPRTYLIPSKVAKVEFERDPRKQNSSQWPDQGDQGCLDNFHYYNRDLRGGHVWLGEPRTRWGSCPWVRRVRSWYLP